MKLNKNIKILIVGLGLLGGSYAKALKEQGYSVSAITKDPEDIEYAIYQGIIDGGTTEIDAGLIAESKLIIFAVYPHIFKEWIKQNGALIKEGTIITDVTGVKGGIVEEIQSMLPDGVEFIAAHPMAGREKSGIQNCDPTIFNGANYIVVPTKSNTEKAIRICKDLGETLGFADVSQLSVEDHDNMIAFLSQLTHCIAVSLMCANNQPDLERYTGDSFRDLTRIADINDEMWSELFLANRDVLLREMDTYRAEFDRLYGYLRDRDREGMREMMKLSSTRRKRFQKRG